MIKAGMVVKSSDSSHGKKTDTSLDQSRESKTVTIVREDGTIETKLVQTAPASGCCIIF